jgi:hypothetical protein
VVDDPTVLVFVKGNWVSRRRESVTLIVRIIRKNPRGNSAVIIEAVGSCEIQSICHRIIINQKNKPLAMRRRNPLTKGYVKVLVRIDNQ